MDEANTARLQLLAVLLQSIIMRDVMRIKNFGTALVSDVDFAASDRQAALRAMHRVKVRPATAVTSGWGTNVAGNDKRSVHAGLNGKGDLRATWWNLYSRIYRAVVPRADLERAMYSFHRVHHAVTLGWLFYVISVEKTTGAIKQDGLLAAVWSAVADDAPGR